MDNEILAILIEKYQNGTITPHEEELLMAWYNQHELRTPYTQRLTAQEKTELSEDLWQSIQQAAGQRDHLIIGRRQHRMGLWWGAAAVALLTALALPVYFHLTDAKRTYDTAFGEIKTIPLPDGSRATLNGNSRLTYKENNSREVWLQGEAFFDVTHTADRQRFLVHLTDTLSVEVVGTEFNIQRRHSGTQIALKSGKIILNKAKERIEMRPNEVVYIGKYVPGGFEKSRGENIGAHLAWQQNRLLLDGTSLAELLEQLEETYGIRTVVEQDSVLSRRATGSIPVVADNQQFLNHIVALYGLVIAGTNDERQFVLAAP